MLPVHLQQISMHAYKSHKQKSNVKVKKVILDCINTPHISIAGFVVCISKTLPRSTECDVCLLQNMTVMGSQGKRIHNHIVVF